MFVSRVWSDLSEQGVVPIEWVMLVVLVLLAMFGLVVFVVASIEVRNVLVARKRVLLAMHRIVKPMVLHVRRRGCWGSLRHCLRLNWHRLRSRLGRLGRLKWLSWLGWFRCLLLRFCG